jgi:hypothetical protein
MDTNSKQIDSIVLEPILDCQSKQISYESTDEDVDELNSNYSEVIDRSMLTIQNYREKFNTRLLSLNNQQNEINPNSTSRSRILSTEYSQMTHDSGVDILSEQKIYQPNTTLTIDEQSSEETTDQNDLFALSDDSLIESPRNNILSISFNQTEQETFFSAKSELNNEIDPYSGYELETITDEDDDHHSIKNDSNELIITSEPPPPPPPSIPPQFEFKLPSFGEWIDRVFTTFLTETNQIQSQSLLSSRSSSIVSIHGSQSTINTSSSSQPITVLENQSLPCHQTQDDNDEHSLNGKSLSLSRFVFTIR